MMKKMGIATAPPSKKQELYDNNEGEATTKEATSTNAATKERSNKKDGADGDGDSEDHSGTKVE